MNLLKNFSPLLLCLPLVMPAATFGADKALLVGVGKYQEASANLPGIDLDVDRMRRLAISMGFKPNQIHVLLDERATLAGIEAELTGWFREGVGPQDRLLLYFSSHGSIVRAADGEEVGAIIPHDFKRVPNNLANVLTGPLLAGLLEENHSHNILLIVDACHSGGLTSRSKGINVDFVPKVLTYDGMPNADLSADLFTAGVPQTKDMKPPNYGYLSACRRDQVAAATKQGSVLTLGLEDAWESLRRAQHSASLAAAQPTIAQFIQKRGINAQFPEVFGDPGLLNADWFTTRQAGVTPPPPPPPPPPVEHKNKAWTDVEGIFQQGSGNFDVRVGRESYVKGELLTLTVTPGREGYLYIFSVGEGDDKPAVLLPNALQAENHVTAGPIAVPQRNATYKISQGIPKGMARQNVLVVAVLTSSPVEMKDLTSGSGTFKDLNSGEESTRSPFVEAASSSSSASTGYLAGKATYVIKANP